MPRGVAKAKDGVEKKVVVKRDVVKKDVVKKDVVKKDVVRRSRKMRGGDMTFYEKCHKFLTDYKDQYNNAIDYIDTKLQELIIEAKDGKDSYYLLHPTWRKSVINSINDIEKKQIYKKKYDSNTNTEIIRVASIDLYDFLNKIKFYVEKNSNSNIKDDEKFYKYIIFCKIFTLMSDFHYLCSIDNIGNINIGNINIADDVATSSAIAVSPAAAPSIETDDNIVVRMNLLYNNNKSDFDNINTKKVLIYARFKSAISNLNSSKSSTYKTFNLIDYFTDLQNRNFFISVKEYIKDIRDTISSIKTKTKSSLFNAIYIDSLEKELKEFESVIDIWLKTINKNIN